DQNIVLESQSNYGDNGNFFGNMNDEGYFDKQIFIGEIKETLFDQKVGYSPFIFNKIGIYTDGTNDLLGGARIAFSVKLEDELEFDNDEILNKIKKLIKCRNVSNINLQ